MPPVAVWAKEKYLLAGTAGVANPPNAAFKATLRAAGTMSASATFLLVAMMPAGTFPALPAGRFGVTVRHTLYLMGAHLIIAAALDSLPLPFFLAPSTVAKILRRLERAGMPVTPVDGWRALRTRFDEWVPKLTDAERTIDTSDVVKPSAPPGCPLLFLSARDIRAGDPDNDNVQLVDFMLLLRDVWTDAGLADANFETYFNMLLPDAASAALAAPARAIKAAANARSTAPPPPFDLFLEEGALLYELVRRQERDAAERFRPLFEKSFGLAYPDLKLLFPRSNAAMVRSHLSTVALGLGLHFSMTPDSVASVVAIVSAQRSSVDMEAPVSSHSDTQRAAEIVRLEKEQPGGVLKAGSSAAADKASKEDMRALLSVPNYVDLHNKLLSLFTTAYQPSDAVSLVGKHAHPAGMIVMLSTRTLPHPGFKSALAIRTRDAQRAAFNVELAVDDTATKHADWGEMLPLVAANATHASHLLLCQKFHLIVDWLGLCRVHVEKNEGAHVLSDPRFALGTDALDFWFSPDMLRLCEQPLRIIFALSGHGESQSVAGSFRHFFFFQQQRAERLARIPNNLAAFPKLKSDCYDAVRLTFTTVAEAAAYLLLAPFATAQRKLFVHGGAVLALAGVDARLVELKTEVQKASLGLSHAQKPHLQYAPSCGGSLAGQSSQTGTTLTFPTMSFPPPPVGTPSVISMSSLPSGYNLSSPSMIGVATPPIGQPTWPAGIYEGWGNYAYLHGVWLTPEGGLQFGRRYVKLKTGTLTFEHGCAAAARVNKYAYKNSGWCVTPMSCKNHAAHALPSGKTKADFQVEDRDLSSMDQSQWTVVVAPHPELANVPCPPIPWRDTTDWTRGDGGHDGDGGDGDGGAGRGGGTKGGGRGKGDGGGKGKGKGGGKGGKGKGKGKGDGKRPRSWSLAGVLHLVHLLCRAPADRAVLRLTPLHCALHDPPSAVLRPYKRRTPAATLG